MIVIMSLFRPTACAALLTVLCAGSIEAQGGDGRKAQRDVAYQSTVESYSKTLKPGMSRKEVESDYEENTGHAIVEAFKTRPHADVPAVLVINHGPFTWGPDTKAAAHNAVILESIARMAYFTLRINPDALPVERHLHDKHHLRKHGELAYYGQAKERK